MRLIIDCDDDLVPNAMALATTEIADLAKYTKVGWGWSFGPHTGRRFFVRRLKDGLSVRQLDRTPNPGADHV